MCHAKMPCAYIEIDSHIEGHEEASEPVRATHLLFSHHEHGFLGLPRISSPFA